jgi:hypothetical protein
MVVATALLAVVALLALLSNFDAARAARDPEGPYRDPIDLNVPAIATDKSIRYDYDIAYVRAPRHGDRIRSNWAEIAHPTLMDFGADLMLLHPDGSEAVLVKAEEGCAVADTAVSFDGKWVYYAYFRGLSPQKGQNRPQAARSADIYKINVATRQIVRLTEQKFTPNTGAADWVDGFVTPQDKKTSLSYGVINCGPCPLPDGSLMFTSNRNGYRPPQGYPPVTLQLFVMDDVTSGGERNVEQIGHLNVAGALHPTIMRDGRVVFSSLESQGLHNNILWGIWSIHPDGTSWGPVVSAFDPGGAPNAFHFQAQISDGSLVVEEYYNLNNNGMGAYLKLPPRPLEGYPAFGPGYMSDERNPPLRFGRHSNAKPKYYRLPFSPSGVEAFTPFANNGEGEADLSLLGDKSSPAVGKFTHPGPAPDNNLLTVWATGPVNHQNGEKYPMPDAGIYLIKAGKAVGSPAEMRLIKNDPNYNEQWPRAVVPYERIYGVKSPAALPALRNDGKLHPALPEGTPYGLVGGSSLYKRESFPNGAVPKGAVTSAFAAKNDNSGGYQGLDPFNTSENGSTLNWFNQGADAGRYSNDDIHAIRILAMEPTTDRNRGPQSGRLFRSHATERLRILGEIPVRKFDRDGKQPTDPDGNPDTSFLAKIPADQPFTFQTLDKDGMVLNMAQTWHQVRPGEVRTNCGGCHAHSQEPTPFEKTAAANAGYALFDLTKSTPLLTAPPRDESKARWDEQKQAGLRYEPSLKNVEYHRDIRPILNRSCVACHNKKMEEQAGRLALDDDAPVKMGSEKALPETYARLAADHGEKSRWGYPPLIKNGSWRNQNASRYVRKFQSRRSLLVWKIYDRRTDGWTNDDFPSETIPGDLTSMKWRGQAIADTPQNRNRADLDYNGRPCPPVLAANGTCKAPDGSDVKIERLSDEDRRTIVRWIDLGCPIDMDFDAAHPDRRGFGWACDDQRPTLAVTLPVAGHNEQISRIVIGAADAYTGLDEKSLSVTADFAIDGAAAGAELASKLTATGQGTWELKLAQPIQSLASGTLTVAIKDRQGNIARIVRTIAVGATSARAR